ncbi:MAG: RnfABCDGE type electron transport complex subunit G [Bacteroidales bacterium]
MAKKESTFGNMVLTLFTVTAVAALALGGVYNATKEPIEMAKRLKIEKAIGEVLPAFDRIEEYKILPEGSKDSLTFYKAFMADIHIGTAVRSYTDQGFSGRIWIMAGFTDENVIYGTSVLEHKETPGLGDKMERKKSDWPEVQFNGKSPENFRLTVKKDGGDVDAITAATITSRAFCDALQRAYDELINQEGE